MPRATPLPTPDRARIPDQMPMMESPEGFDTETFWENLMRGKGGGRPTGTGSPGQTPGPEGMPPIGREPPPPPPKQKRAKKKRIPDKKVAALLESILSKAHGGTGTMPQGDMFVPGKDLPPWMHEQFESISGTGLVGVDRSRLSPEEQMMLARILKSWRRTPSTPPK